MSRYSPDHYKIKTPALCRMIGVSRMTLYTWEQKGLFTPPRFGLRGDRVFTETQAKEIREAFSPGGKGHWHFKPL
jgi:DNA-binding transcriptional MerR regulator